MVFNYKMKFHIGVDKNIYKSAKLEFNRYACSDKCSPRLDESSN